MFEGSENPLLTDSPGVWDQLIEAIGPASLLVVIESRMSAALKRSCTPEDIWQETLLHVWRDRGRCEWRGLKRFRGWVLTVADRRIHDAADRIAAQKRGGGVETLAFSGFERGDRGGSTLTAFLGPVGSTTPSRLAIHAEQAAAMRAALEALPKRVRDVVRLRLFEQLTVEEVAEHLGIGVGAARHRFREGAALYRRRLTNELASRSQSGTSDTARRAGDSSSSDR